MAAVRAITDPYVGGCIHVGKALFLDKVFFFNVIFIFISEKGVSAVLVVHVKSRMQSLRGLPGLGDGLAAFISLMCLID